MLQILDKRHKIYDNTYYYVVRTAKGNHGRKSGDIFVLRGKKLAQNISNIRPIEFSFEECLSIFLTRYDVYLIENRQERFKLKMALELSK